MAAMLCLWAAPVPLAEAVVPGPSGKIAFASNRDGNFEIYTVDPQGGSPTNVTRHPARDENPSWSPDGRRLAFESDREGTRHIYYVFPGAAGVNRVAEGSDPAWSPDGREIAFVRGRDIYVRNLRSGAERNVTRSDAQSGAFDPAWSPDGRRIAFTARRFISSTPPDDIALVNGDGTGGFIQLTDDIEHDHQPAWSPDGTKIAWMSTGGGGDFSRPASIWTMNPDGTGRTLVAGGAELLDANQQPTWSPDGSKIAYVRGALNGDIIVINADGSAPTRLTTGGQDRFPDWQRQASPRGWGYAWADQPAAAGYTPSPPYQFNSTGALNTITRSGTGDYTITFPGIGVAGGTAHVTSYGDGPEFCKLGSIGPSTSRELVNVRCFSSTGSPVDTTFTVSFTRRTDATAPMGYVLADQPTATAYAPSLVHQFNSTGAPNTVSRVGAGEYRVTLPNLGAAAGHVQVTAYGAGAARCKVRGWQPIAGAQLVRVGCHTPSGTPADSMFTMTYVRDLSLVGAEACCPAPPGPFTWTAYAWAQDPLAASYAPDRSYQFSNSGAVNTVTRTGVGSWTVNMPSAARDRGHVQVTAYGSTAAACKVASWGLEVDIQRVRVKCFTTTGAPADKPFTAIFFASHFTG